MNKSDSINFNFTIFTTENFKMATVKRPRINLHIPFNKENRCICIEYPGNVKNPKKMIQTLGGLKMIEHVSFYLIFFSWLILCIYFCIKYFLCFNHYAIVL